MDKEWLKNGFILYGCGLEAEKFICRNITLLDKIDICVDGYRKGLFHGIEIKQIEEIEKIHEKKIVVATLSETYKHIKNILTSYDLEEFKHYVHISYIEKKIVAINANCHGAGLSKYLNMSKEFRDRYVILDVPEIQNNKEKELSKALLDNIDVLITQDIRFENKFSSKLSLEYLKLNVNNSCRIIVIPNMVGMGKWLFPQHGDEDKIVHLANGDWPLIHENTVLEIAIKNGCKSIQEYIDVVNNYEIDRTIMEKCYQQFLQKIENREKNWDIKIKDFIQTHLKDMEIFCDRDHPSVELMKYIGREVLKELSISIIDDREYDFILGLPMPLLPCIKRCYNISYAENDCLNYYRCNNDELIKKYITYYLFIYHDIKL